MSQPTLGLRERKKQLTRSTIADTALQLVLEKGLERVTLEEIARIAFVSPRTVSNYFSGKEEAIAAAGRNLSDSIVDDLAERPADEAPLESVFQVTVKFIRSLTPNELEAQRQKRRLGEQYPAIKAYLTARYELAEELTRPAMAARSGTDLDGIYPWLLAASAVAAVKVTVARWATTDTDREELLRMINASFAHLQNGLQAPPQTGEEKPSDWHWMMSWPSPAE